MPFRESILDALDMSSNVWCGTAPIAVCFTVDSDSPLPSCSLLFKIVGTIVAKACITLNIVSVVVVVVAVVELANELKVWMLGDGGILEGGERVVGVKAGVGKD